MRVISHYVVAGGIVEMRYLKKNIRNDLCNT